MFRKVGSLLIFCLSLWTVSLAQHYPSRNFTTADGLPNNAIRALHMDSRGILWIGTENGISKMENGEFQNFYEKDGLAFNSCWAIGEDSEGKLWLGSYGGGITIYDGKKAYLISSKDGLTDDRIRIFFSYKNWMIVGTEDGITLIDVETLEVIPVESSVKRNGLNYISDIFEKDGKVYFSTYRSGFYELFWEDSIPKTKLLNDWLPIYSTHLDGDDILLADKGTVHQIDFEDFIAGKSPSKALGQSIIWTTVPIGESKNLMLANGLYTKTGGAFLYENSELKNVTEEMGITSRFLLSGIYNPVSKTLFVGTQDKGLFEVNMSERVAYFPMEGQEVNGFAGDENTLGILSTQGFNIQTEAIPAIVVSRQKFKETQASFYQNYPSRIPKHMDGFYELDPEIKAEDIDFYEVHWQDQTFWINTNIGVFQVNGIGEIVTYLPVHSYSLGFTPDGKLLETSPFAGVRIYSDPGAMQFEYFEPEEENTPLQVVKVVQGEDQSYLASVFFGLYKWNGSRFHSYLKSGEWDEVKLKALHLMESGDLLIGTEFGEVFQINAEDDFKIKKKWDNDEILGNAILFIKSYKDAILIGTELGIQVISPDFNRLLDTEHGIHEKITLGAKRVGDYLYLGTNKGYYQLNLPELLQVVPSEIDLFVSELKINHSSLDSSNFLWFNYIGGKLALQAEENTLQVSFLPKGNLYPKNLQYRYRLNETALWSDYSDVRDIELPFLPPGEYNLEVEVLNNHSGKTKVSSLLEFVIDYPFYRKWWFALTVFLFTAGVLTWIYRVRTKEIRLKSHLNQRMAEIKLEALRSQMNPHFIFNALNSIQYFILKKDMDEALSYLNKFSKLVRLTLHHISSSSITLKEEIDYLERYISVENSRIDERATWEITGNAIANAENIHLSPMLIQPLIENVFVHAFPSDYPNPKLRVTLNLDGDFLVCTISDNGIGIDPSKNLNTSKGMELIRERLKLLGHEATEAVHISSILGESTDVTIKIPVTY